MASSAVRVPRKRKLDRVSSGRPLTPAAGVLIAVGTAAVAAWFWSRATQPDIDAATFARLQRRPAGALGYFRSGQNTQPLIPSEVEGRRLLDRASLDFARDERL